MSATEQDILILRTRVKELENRLDFLYQKLGFEYVNNPSMANSQVVALIKEGKKIEAIKVYRELSNTGLAEAKEAVEKIEATLL